MRIDLSPQRRDDTLVISKIGDKLTINDQVVDFSVIPDGATYPDGSDFSPYIIGPVERINGEINITLILPNAANASEAARFPQPISVADNGPVELPK